MLSKLNKVCVAVASREKSQSNSWMCPDSHHRLYSSLMTYTHYFPFWGKMDKFSENKVTYMKQHWAVIQESLTFWSALDGHCEQAVLPQ